MRECFCFGSEAVNASGEAVRGLVKSRVEFPPAQISGKFTRGFAARKFLAGFARKKYSGSASRQLRRLVKNVIRCFLEMH